MLKKTATCIPLNHLKPHLSCSEMPNVTSADSLWATTSPILHPTSGLPKGYTPIPTLLAKSVGNKVTLMKRPPDVQSVSFSDGQSKRPLVSLSPAMSVMSHMSNSQSSSTSSQQNQQQINTQSHVQIHGQPGIIKILEPKPSQAEPKTPVHVMKTMGEGTDQAVRKDNRISMNTLISSDMDQIPAEKQIQQLVILQSNPLVKKPEAKVSSSNPLQSKGTHVGGSKVCSPIFISTDVSGFSIPETKIPVQRVPPLKDAKTMKTTPVFCHLSQGGQNKGGSKGICNVQANMAGVSAPSPITTISSAVSTEMAKSTDPKQELKTVCIRDSQSILVTTRGGNTGIVKVQTSSDQNALGSFPTCPVITISPQFKAFLISKTASTLSDPSTFQASTTSFPTETSAPLTQKLVLDVPSTAKSSVHMADSSSIPVKDSENQAKGTAVAPSQDFSSSVGSAVQTKKLQSGSCLPVSMSKNPAASSTSSSGDPQSIPRETTRRTGVKLTSTEEPPCVSKYILVNSPSSSKSTVMSPKSPPSSTKPVPSTRVTFVPQPSSTNFAGSVPKLVMGVSSSGWTSTTSFLSRAPKMGSSPTQPVASISSEALFNTKNIALSSGVQNQLTGKMTSIGQNIGSLSHFSSNSASVTVPGTCSYTSTTTTTGLVSDADFARCYCSTNWKHCPHLRKCTCGACTSTKHLYNDLICSTSRITADEKTTARHGDQSSTRKTLCRRLSLGYPYRRSIKAPH
ncbi:hypothetical protein OJAV_G00120350 [Oryzias javanicus]|uniref:Uncharacterized protein n=1 Tax=Oryzias javanicus TaxID=123683 RepID=A0A3S2MS80_ORYJA|nr:hypothetical protein OJAV_G00120350 [Oryzias javanicus]